MSLSKIVIFWLIYFLATVWKLQMRNFFFRMQCSGFYCASFSKVDFWCALCWVGAAHKMTLFFFSKSHFMIARQIWLTSSFKITTTNCVLHKCFAFELETPSIFGFQVWLLNESRNKFATCSKVSLKSLLF